MSQNLSHHNTVFLEPRFKTIVIIVISTFTVCWIVSIVFDYAEAPIQEPLRRNIELIEDIKPDIMANPLIIKNNIDMNGTIARDEKLLGWNEFRVQRRLDISKPKGFRSVLQRHVKFNEGHGFFQIVEFSDNLDAFHFLWNLPSDSKHDRGFKYDSSLWTISGRFLQVSPDRAFSSAGEQIKLHNAIASNLGKSLMELSNIRETKTLSFENFEWDKKSLGRVLKLELFNHELYLADSKILDSFDSISYKVRNYALGDVELKRVISIATSRTLIARSDGDYVLMSSEFPRNLDLIQKYKVQRLFR
ncbi:MAG: hypothetical protein VX619_08620 [bacterium]|nr:hypothetical protein [bacterium]